MVINGLDQLFLVKGTNKLVKSNFWAVNDYKDKRELDHLGSLLKKDTTILSATTGEFDS